MIQIEYQSLTSRKQQKADRDSIWDLWDTSECQGKVIEEIDKRVIDLEKLVAGQLDHIAEVTRLVEQVPMCQLQSFSCLRMLTIVSIGLRLPVLSR